MSAVDERVAEKRKLDEKDTENGVAAKGAKIENGIVAVSSSNSNYVNCGFLVFIFVVC